jgi:cytochrome P450
MPYVVTQAEVPRTIPGPTQATTLSQLLPRPFTRLPAFLDKMIARYGDIFAFQVLWRRYVVINDPSVVKDVFVTKQHVFAKSSETHVMGLLLGGGLLTSEQPKHRVMRRIVQPAFHHERIKCYMETMRHDASDYTSQIVPNRPIDVHSAMTELTLRIASKTLFGSDESASARSISEALTVTMEEFTRILTPFGRLRMSLPLPSTRRFNEARRTLDELIFSMISRRRQDPTDRGDVMSMLLITRDEKGQRLSDLEIRDEVMTLFMAGHETTANAMTWTLYLMGRMPHIEEAVTNAVERGDEEYLSRVLKESLRLYPPAWIIGRRAIKDVTLIDGTPISANTTVLVAPLTLHRRAKSFANPGRFDPDRWIDHAAPFGTYVPFGGGSRRCIGEEFALAEGRIVLSTLVAAYRFVPISEKVVGIHPLVTLRPATPVWLRPVPRAGRLRKP